MAAAQITSGAAVRRGPSPPPANPAGAHPNMSALVPSRGNEGVVDSDVKRVAPRGGLVWPERWTFTARVARPGRIRRNKSCETFVYPREELFADEMVCSFDGAPVLLGHSGKRVGTAVFPRIVGDFIIAELVIDTPRALRAIALGMRQLSPGFTATSVARTVQGEPLRVVRDMRLNHIGLCRLGAARDLRLLSPDEVAALPKEDDEP
jgi:Uncharacterized protein conserved in bacteria (DUF2213)